MKATSGIHQCFRDRDEDGNADEKIAEATVSVKMVSARDDQRSAASCHLNVVLNSDPADMHSMQPARSGRLSIRAQNVLKILSMELTGEEPPPGEWVPSDLLLQRLTYRHLSTARNCGPHTTAEIIKWVQVRGINIRRSFHAGKSLSAMWQEIIVKFLSGEISKTEVVEALEKSARRRNTRIPVAFQRMLLRLVDSSSE